MIGKYKTENKDTVFMTIFHSESCEAQAVLLVKSLRRFGGYLRDSPFWIFHFQPTFTPKIISELPCSRLIQFDSDQKTSGYEFGEKIAACALAEKMAKGEFKSLVFLSLDCLIVNEPILYDLSGFMQAAFRTPHIKNVGSPANEAMDDYWKGICDLIKPPESPFTVETYVDLKRIRPYFNTHNFSIDPSVGVFGKWLECFCELVADNAFQRTACKDETHRIFLHQAILSTLLMKMMDIRRFRFLPPEYNYPMNFHKEMPEDRKPRFLNELVSPVFEEKLAKIEDIARNIQIREPLLSWLCENLPQI